jgi:DNA-binding response OmpR family regulator
MAARVDSLSVLVVDDSPALLAFLGRVLDAAGIRALLARDKHEAVGIAEREYVPIDLILANIRRSDGADASDLVKRLRDLRPNVRALRMSARLDSEVIRLDCLNVDLPDRDHKGLIETIRSAASAPLVRRAAGSSSN